MPAADATTRFSSRVSDYITSRPSYPPEVATLLTKHFNLVNPIIADIGSGTGLSSATFLAIPGARVIGIEPNADMRAAGDKMLAGFAQEERFESRDGTAENTGLEAGECGLGGCGTGVSLV